MIDPPTTKFDRIGPSSVQSSFCCQVHARSTSNSYIYLDLLARTTMPHCPRCGIRYKTHEKITRHLNQPRSSCANLISDLISIPLPTSRSQNVSPEGGSDDFDMNYMGDSNVPALGDPGSDIEMAVADSGLPANVTTSTHREEFADAAQAWAGGKTFLDCFDLDDHAYLRQKNLYYPFASKHDWEMAAFLLRSGLSMALIDDFLKLQLVSTWRSDVSTYYLIQVSRFMVYHSRFEQRRS